MKWLTAPVSGCILSSPTYQSHERQPQLTVASLLPEASADRSQRKTVLASRPTLLCLTCRNKPVRGFERTVSPSRQMQASSCKLIKAQGTWGRAKRPTELHNLKIQVAPNYIWREANELFVYFSFKIQRIVEKPVLERFSRRQPLEGPSDPEKCAPSVQGEGAQPTG